jgi:hypothetical protein
LTEEDDLISRALPRVVVWYFPSKLGMRVHNVRGSKLLFVLHRKIDAILDIVVQTSRVGC